MRAMRVGSVDDAWMRWISPRRVGGGSALSAIECRRVDLGCAGPARTEGLCLGRGWVEVFCSFHSRVVRSGRLDGPVGDALDLAHFDHFKDGFVDDLFWL